MTRRPLEISDEDSFHGDHYYAVASEEEPAEPRRSVADRLTLTVDPVPQTVAASVRVRYTLAPPDFG